ncbi:MAG TPA: TMEM175 family protein [Candidatus Limnocylindrales bacterium]|nr:TMEM175 family protein [Candidatus Limnocylindrales bacterium]
MTVPRRYRTNRLEAFSDGVFAIAITLLVLEIGVPLGSEDDLLEAIIRLWPSYLAYLVSFATIGAVWVAHSVITEHVEGADPVFLRLNLLLLFFVSFLPFPTKLLGEYLGTEEEAVRVAVTFYGLALLLTSVTTSALWGWARHVQLIHETARGSDPAV